MVNLQNSSQQVLTLSPDSSLFMYAILSAYVLAYIPAYIQDAHAEREVLDLRQSNSLTMDQMYKSYRMMGLTSKLVGYHHGNHFILRTYANYHTPDDKYMYRTSTLNAQAYLLT